MIRRICACGVLLASAAIAQQQKTGEETLVVPKKYLSQEAIDHAVAPLPQEPVVEVSKWVGLGREVGQAMNEGLGAVVTQTDKFGATRVGNFVMAAIAWRIFGEDLKAVVLGIPTMIAGVALWVWSYRKFLCQRRVLAKQDGKVREWRTEVYEFRTNDAKATSATFHGIALFLWLTFWLLKIF